MQSWDVHTSEGVPLNVRQIGIGNALHLDQIVRGVEYVHLSEETGLETIDGRAERILELYENFLFVPLNGWSLMEQTHLD